MTTRKMTMLAMLTAVYVVLSVTTPVKIISFKFTFEAFPILVAGLLFGPVEGMIVGLLGSGIYQVFLSSYGITPTTPLWILPHVLNGLIAGLLGRKLKEMNMVNVVIIAMACAFTVTVFNTVALYVDSRMFGYYTEKLVFGALGMKFLIGIILSIVYALVLPQLIGQLRKIVK